MKLTGAEALVKMLEDEGVEVVFGYPGATIAPVFDALSRSGIRHILPRGEQAAAHEASGYARVSGKVGVCMATSGPGATNLITGIATAYMDSIPMVAITGQVDSAMIGRDAFQEADITGATEPFTKHNYLVKDVNDLPRIVREAFYIASTGRKGPVLIDLPIDVAEQEFTFHMPKEAKIRGYRPTVVGNNLQVRKIREALANAKAPVIIAGGGVGAAGAQQALAELAGKYNIPVVATLMGIDAASGCNEQFIGMLGTHGVSPANIAVKRCDLMLVAGARLGDRAYMLVHAEDENATVIHIDIDPAEIGKNVGTDIPVVGDVRVVLEQILSKDIDCDVEGNKRFLQEIQELRDKPYTYTQKDGAVNPKLFMKELSDVTSGKAVVVTEVGQNQIWAANGYKQTRGGKFLTSGGLGTMGYGLPAAIGAKIADMDKTVIAIAGDGSFQMSLPELATMVQWNVPVKIVIFNNNRLGMVRELQKKLYNGNYFAVFLDGSPDFIKLAGAYGIPGSTICQDKDITKGLKTMLQSEGPYLLQVMVDSEQGTL